MPITALDHIHVETHDWKASAAFWEGLGFTFSERWGEPGHRAGRLEAGAAAVVLAEVDAAAPTACNAFLALTDGDEYAMTDAVDVERGLSRTHWGSRWIRVTDPDGRVFRLEETRED